MKRFRWIQQIAVNSLDELKKACGYEVVPRKILLRNSYTGDGKDIKPIPCITLKPCEITPFAIVRWDRTTCAYDFFSAVYELGYQSVGDDTLGILITEQKIIDRERSLKLRKVG